MPGWVEAATASSAAGTTWHLEVADGDVLTWLVVDRPHRDPSIADFRSDRRGGVHEDDGYRLLTEHGHPDVSIRRHEAHAGGAFH